MKSMQTLWRHAKAPFDAGRSTRKNCPQCSQKTFISTKINKRENETGWG